MKLKKLIRKKKHRQYIAEYILCLDFECDNLRKRLRSVNDKTLIRKIIFKTKLQKISFRNEKGCKIKVFNKLL